MTAHDRGGATGTGAWTRARFAFQVVVMVVLAAAAAGAATWLSERPGLHRRFDLTSSRRNTLDPRLTELLDRMPDRAMVEIFFRPVAKPLTEIGAEAQERMRELLFVAQNQAPSKLKVIDHDLTDLAGARDALVRLGVEGDQFGLVVVHRDQLKTVLRLFTDIAHVDLGNPSPSRYVPPRLASFRGEEALALALKRVSLGAPPKVLFSTGHGERSLSETGDFDLSRMHTALVADGFEVGAWDWRAASEIPDDCAVFALIAPKQPLLPAEVLALENFLRRGGRLLVAPSDESIDQSGGVKDLLGRYGLALRGGFVANGVPTGTGDLQWGTDACANLFLREENLDPRHPVTETLYRYHSTVWFIRARPLDRGNVPADSVLVELARSSQQSWVDLPDAGGAQGKHDWTPDRSREEVGRSFTVAAALTMPAADAPPTAAGEAVRDARIVVLTTPEVLVNGCFQTNADFALNAFNWLSAREYRVSIATRADDRRILEVRTGSHLATVQRVAVVVLPGLCALLGILLAWKRKR